MAHEYKEFQLYCSDTGFIDMVVNVAWPSLESVLQRIEAAVSIRSFYAVRRITVRLCVNPSLDDMPDGGNPLGVEWPR
jgi:hypothetical protein